MLIRRLSAALSVIFLFLSASPGVLAQTLAPDLTGTWTGKVTATKEGSPPTEEAIHVVLKQTGSAITGSAGPRADRQQEINTGKVETTKGITTLTFDTGRTGHVLYFEMKLADDTLKGTVKDEYYKTTMAAELQRTK